MQAAFAAGPAVVAGRAAVRGHDNDRSQGPGVAGFQAHQPGNSLQVHQPSERELVVCAHGLRRHCNAGLPGRPDHGHRRVPGGAGCATHRRATVLTAAVHRPGDPAARPHTRSPDRALPRPVDAGAVVVQAHGGTNARCGWTPVTSCRRDAVASSCQSYSTCGVREPGANPGLTRSGEGDGRCTWPSMRGRQPLEPRSGKAHRSG